MWYNLVLAQAPYCTPSYGTACATASTNDFINNFSTTNGSTNIVNNNSGCNNMPNNYIYYPNKIVTAAQGCSFNISIQCGAIYQQGFGIWIDFNHNNSFTDPGEFVWNSGSAGFQVFSGVINIPATALLGLTRMRVRSNYAATPSNPCNNQTFGEVEDYQVDIIPSANVPPIGVNDTICAGQNAQLTASGAGTLQWFTVPAGGSVVQTGGILNTPALNNTTTYYVQSVVGGCISPRTPVTAVVGANFTVNISVSADTVCAGGNVTLTASGTNLSYSWTPASAVNNPNGNPVTAIVNAQTTFTLVATNNTGCSVTVSKVINVYPTPTLNTVVSPPQICFGDTAIITVTGASNCTWTSGYLYANAANDSIWVSPAAATTYTVSATALNGCVGSQTASIQVNQLPIANAGADETICSGASVALNASGGVTYSWTPTTGLSASNINNPIVSLSNTQTYTLHVTDINGCTNSDTITVNVTPLPVANPGVNAAVCPGGTTTLNGAGGTSFVWSPATGLNNANIANPTCTPAVTTTYTLTVSNGNCTSLPSAPITVTVHNQPAAPTITANGPISFCQGNSVVLSSSNPTNNVWSNGATTNAITVNTSGTYTVYYTDANSCSSVVSAPTSVLVYNLPAVPIVSASGPLTVCDGGTVTLTSTGATAYNWSTGETSQSITVTSSGNYSVTVTDANGCTATSVNTIFTVLPPPVAPTITANGSLSFCTGGSVVLTSSPAASYLWSNGATTQSITVNASGSYTVTNTNAGGCVTPSSAVINTNMFPVPPPPVITASGTLTFCNGNNVVLTSTPAAAYNWNNTYITQNITILQSGTYNLSIIDANGCPSPPSQDVVVTVYPLPQPPLITALGPVSFCSGSSVVLESSQTNGNLWSTGSTANSITVNTTGNYTLTYTDINNCTSLPSNPVSVTVIPLAPTPTITASGPTTFCQNDSVVLTCSQAQTYLWNTGSTSPTLTIKAAGTYTVMVTDVCNPIIPSASVNITINPNPTASFNALTLVDCLPSSINFINTSSGIVNSLWSFGDGTISQELSPNHAYQFSGLYTVSLTVFDNNGCRHTKSRQDYIKIFPPVEINYTVTPKVTDLLNASVVFSNNTSNTAIQHWVSDNLFNTYNQNFSFNYENTGTFPFELTVTTTDGCIEHIKDSVLIEDNYLIYFPTSFTPNGDGLNDLFQPLGAGVEEFTMEIYNRWGIIVHKSTNINQPWDGVGLPQDNYVWRVSLKDNKGVYREKTGSVTLIR